MSGVETFTRKEFEAALPVHRETGKPLTVSRFVGELTQSSQSKQT